VTSTQDRSSRSPSEAPAPPVPLPGRAAVGGPDEGDRGDTAERGAWTLVWLGVLGAGLSTWGDWTEASTLSVLGPAVVLVATVGLVACWLVRTPRARSFQWLALAAVAVSLVASQYGPIHVRRFYTTDAAAFDHVAALAMAHGHNPYTSSMATAAALLDVPARFWTYTASGGFVHDVSYPAGSFLVYAPAAALGFHHQIVDWVDLGMWILTGTLVFVLLPRRLRFLAALLTITPLFVGVFSSGGTDVPFLPFLVLAVWRWDRYGGPRSAGAARWMGPVALGLACAIKQTPWFCVPFLVAGVALEARRRGGSPVALAARYLAVVVGVFALVDAPFAVAAPGAWWHGTVTPLAQPLVADGQGLVTLATQGIVRGVDLTALSVSAGLVFAALLAGFVASYPRLARVWVLLVPLALFFSARSLSSYLVDLLPAALIAAVSVGTAPDAGPEAPSPSPTPSARRRRWAGVACGLCAAGAVAAGVAAFAGPPLAIAVTGVHTGQGGIRLDAITVEVRNRTGRPQVPHVLVDTASHPSGFWLPRHGPMAAVPPGGERTYTLYPPIVAYSALRGVRWVVQAYTSNPRALSTSAVQVGRRPPPAQ